MLYAFNVDDVDFALGADAARAEAEGLFRRIRHCDPAADDWTLVSAQLEAELGLRDPAGRAEYVGALGLDGERGRALDAALSHNALPTRVRGMLGLSVCYTGPGVPAERSRTTRAHLFPRGGLTAEQLAGRIHGDIQRGFMHAEVTPAETLLLHASFGAAKEAGDVRTEGRECAVAESDVVLIRWK